MRDFDLDAYMAEDLAELEEERKQRSSLRRPPEHGAARVGRFLMDAFRPKNLRKAGDDLLREQDELTSLPVDEFTRKLGRPGEVYYGSMAQVGMQAASLPANLKRVLGGERTNETQQDRERRQLLEGGPVLEPSTGRRGMEQVRGKLMEETAPRDMAEMGFSLLGGFKGAGAIVNKTAGLVEDAAPLIGQSAPRVGKFLQNIAQGTKSEVVKDAAGFAVKEAPSFAARTARNVVSSTPLDVAYATGTPEESTLGQVANMTGNDRLKALAKHPGARLAVESGINLVAGGAIEEGLRGAGKLAGYTMMHGGPGQVPSAAAARKHPIDSGLFKKSAKAADDIWIMPDGSGLDGEYGPAGPLGKRPRARYHAEAGDLWDDMADASKEAKIARFHKEYGAMRKLLIDDNDGTAYFFISNETTPQQAARIVQHIQEYGGEVPQITIGLFREGRWPITNVKIPDAKPGDVQAAVDEMNRVWKQNFPNPKDIVPMGSGPQNVAKEQEDAAAKLAGLLPPARGKMVGGVVKPKALGPEQAELEGFGPNSSRERVGPRDPNTGIRRPLGEGEHEVRQNPGTGRWEVVSQDQRAARREHNEGTLLGPPVDMPDDWTPAGAVYGDNYYRAADGGLYYREQANPFGNQHRPLRVLFSSADEATAREWARAENIADTSELVPRQRSDLSDDELTSYADELYQAWTNQRADTRQLRDDPRMKTEAGELERELDAALEEIQARKLQYRTPRDSVYFSVLKRSIETAPAELLPKQWLKRFEKGIKEDELNKWSDIGELLRTYEANDPKRPITREYLLKSYNERHPEVEDAEYNTRWPAKKLKGQPEPYDPTTDERAIAYRDRLAQAQEERDTAHRKLMELARSAQYAEGSAHALSWPVRRIVRELAEYPGHYSSADQDLLGSLFREFRYESFSRGEVEEALQHPTVQEALALAGRVHEARQRVNRIESAGASYRQRRRAEARGESPENAPDRSNPSWDGLRAPGSQGFPYRVLVAKNKKLAGMEKADAEWGPHFREENQIVHMRTTDRTAGKNYDTREQLVHAEEIQGDFAQSGATYGFKGNKESDLELLKNLDVQWKALDERLKSVRHDGIDPDIPQPTREEYIAKLEKKVEGMKKSLKNPKVSDEEKATKAAAIEAGTAELERIQSGGELPSNKLPEDRRTALIEKLETERDLAGKQMDRIRERQNARDEGSGLKIGYMMPKQPLIERSTDWVALAIRRLAEETAVSGRDALSIVSPNQIQYPSGHSGTWKGEEGLRSFYDSIVDPTAKEELAALKMPAEYRDIGIPDDDLTKKPGAEREYDRDSARDYFDEQVREEMDEDAYRDHLSDRYDSENGGDSDQAERDTLNGLSKGYWQPNDTYGLPGWQKIKALERFIDNLISEELVDGWPSDKDSLVEILREHDPVGEHTGLDPVDWEEEIGNAIDRVLDEQRDAWMDDEPSYESWVESEVESRMESDEEDDDSPFWSRDEEDEDFEEPTTGTPSGTNLVAPVTPEAYKLLQKEGVRLYMGGMDPHEIARLLMNQYGQQAVAAAFGAGVGAAVDDEHPGRGAALGGLAGFAGAKALQKGLPKLRGRQADIQFPQRSKVSPYDVIPGPGRLQSKLNTSFIKDLTTKELRSEYGRVVKRLAQATDQTPPHVRDALETDLESLLEEFQARGGEPRTETTAEPEGRAGRFRKKGKALLANEDVDVEEFVGKLGRFVLDPTGEKELAARAERLIRTGDAARRRVPWAETEAKARKLASKWGIRVGADLETALNEGSLKAMDAGQLDAATAMLADNTKTLDQVYTKLSTMDPNDARFEKLARLSDSIEQQTDQILSKFVTARSEAGRALNILKKQAMDTMDPVFWMVKTKRALGDRPLTDVHLKQLNDLLAQKDRAGLAQFVANLQKATPMEKLATWWKAGLLTGLRTHEVNFLSNLTHLSLDQVKDVPAYLTDRVLFGAVKALETAKLVAPGTAQKTKALHPGIQAAMLRAKKNGRQGALKAFTEAMKGKAPTGGYKVDMRGEVTYEGIPVVSPLLNVYTRAVFRALGASDAAFKTVAFEKSIAEQAHVLANSKSERTQMMREPTDEMVLRAIEDAEVVTFTNAGTLARIGSEIKRGRPATEFILPFTKTPANVVTRVADYSPIGPLLTGPDLVKFSKAVWKGDKKGTYSAQKAIAERLGRSATGSALAVWLGMTLARQGKISGHRADSSSENQQNELEGKTENSVLINGRWRSLEKVSPLGNMIILGADMYRAGEEGENRLMAAAGSIGQTVTEQSFLEGASQTIDVLRDEAGARERWPRSMASSAIPTIVRQAARGGDLERTQNSVGDALKAGLPKLRGQLEPQVTQFGDYRRAPSRSRVMLDPFSSSPDRRREDPLVETLSDAQVNVSKLRKSPDELPVEYTERAELEGAGLRDVLDRLVATREFQALDQIDRQEALERAVRSYRARTSRARNR